MTKPRKEIQPFKSVLSYSSHEQDFDVMDPSQGISAVTASKSPSIAGSPMKGSISSGNGFHSKIPLKPPPSKSSHSRKRNRSRDVIDLTNDQPSSLVELPSTIRSSAEAPVQSPKSLIMGPWDTSRQKTPQEMPSPPADDNPAMKLEQLQDEKANALAEVARLQKQLQELQKEQSQQQVLPSQGHILSPQVCTI
jgi:hypothetical protein